MVKMLSTVSAICKNSICAKDISRVGGPSVWLYMDDFLNTLLKPCSHDVAMI